MSRKYKIVLGILLLVAVMGVTAWYFTTHTVAVLQTEGTIAHQQRRLIFIALLLSIVVVLPVFVMLAVIVSKYRVDSRKKGKYDPKFDHSRLIESIWWGVPTILIIILSVIAFRSSHALDPFKPIESSVKPVTIQVVALQWKWLFIYPGHGGLASVNYVQFPEKTPVNFVITADAPMNSFWIPQLGGQVYAMTGMSTKLHLIADKTGTYEGSSANISGEGFAGMRFKAESRSQNDFAAWVQKTKETASPLTSESYKELAKPSRDMPVTFYSASEPALYDTIVTQYMPPAKTKTRDEHLNHTHEHGESH